MRKSALLLMLLLPACGAARGTPGAAGPETVIVHVQNTSTRTLVTHVCGPVACSPEVAIAASADETFRVAPGRGTRAVVTAKDGDRVVGQYPLDFQPGETLFVKLALPHTADAP